MYAQDYDGWVPGYGATMAAKPALHPGWANWLIFTGWGDNPPLISNTSGYVSNRNLFFCPSQYPSSYTEYPWSNWDIFTYGINRDLGAWYQISNARNIPNPENFTLIADTVFARRADLAQSGYFFPGYLAEHNGIHLRHNGHADVLFADGHVEACGPARLNDSGVAAWINQDYSEQP
jgi:prepilin-type processing-associated H-X9-DG protein